MTWGATNVRGTAANRVVASTHAVVVANANITVGQIAMLRTATDNIATASGTSANHTAVTDSKGNSWTKLYEYTRSSGAAADGVTISAWATKVTTELVATVDTVTLTLSASVTAKAATLWQTSVGAGNTFSVAGANGANGSSTSPSVTLSGLASASYYWLGLIGVEGRATETTTADADYGVPEGKTGTDGGAVDPDNIRVYSTRRANFTATTDTYNPTIGTSADWAAALIAMSEVAESFGPVTDSDGFTITDNAVGGGGGGGTPAWKGGPTWGLGFQNCIGVSLDDSVMIGADVAGFSFTEDDGRTVTMSNLGFTNITDRNIAGILPHHTDPDTWYALTNNALQRSTDRGGTWTKMSLNSVDQQPSAKVPNLDDPTTQAEDGRPRSTGNVLFWGSVAPSGNRWMYALSWNSGVYRSSNNGATFTRIWGSTNSNIYLRGGACVTQNGVDDLYIGAWESGNGTGGLYHIDNAGGLSITPQVTPMDTPFVSVEEVSTIVPDNTTRHVGVVGFAGSNAVRSWGCWIAQNPGNTTSGAWQRAPVTQVSPDSWWSAIDGRERAGQPNVWAIGCFQGELTSGQYRTVAISLDGGDTFTSITADAAKVHHDDVGGAGGPSWPVAAAGNDVGGAGHSLAGPSQLRFNSDLTRLWASHYAGAWKCELPLSPTGRHWYPTVDSLQVTINGDIAVDPNDPGTAFCPNVDRGGFLIEGHGATASAIATGFDASRATQFNAAGGLYVWGGDRDSNVDGDVVFIPNPTGAPSTRHSLESAGGQILSGLTGGKRAYGGRWRDLGASDVILGAVTGHGMVRYVWDGAGTPNDGTWTTVKANPPMANASPSNKFASMVWEYDDIALLYDPSSGLWRGKNGATINGSNVMTSWVQLFAEQSGQTGTGFVVHDPANKERCFLSTDAGLRRLDNIFSAANASEVTNNLIARPTAQVPGPIAIDGNGRLWHTTRAGTVITPHIYRTSQRGSLAPTWDEMCDPEGYYHRACGFPTQMAVASDGTVYMAHDGFGTSIGTNTSVTVNTVTDSDGLTVTDNSSADHTGAPLEVIDFDGFTVTDTAISSASGSYQSEVSADSPVAWWKMNETAGASTVEDYGSGTDADMTVHEAATIEFGMPGVDGTAMHFGTVGVAEYLDVASAAKLQIVGNLTVEAIFRFDNAALTQLGTIFSERFGDGDVRYAMGFYDAVGVVDTLKPFFGWYNGAWQQARSSADLVVGQTYHLVGRYNGSALDLFVNGVLAGTDASPGTQPGGNTNVQIGRRWDNATNEYIEGTIQHVALYNTALSDARIAAHAAAAVLPVSDSAVVDSDGFTVTETSTAVVPPFATPTPPGPVVPPPLPVIRHSIRSPAGEASPDVGEWSAEETAPGGYGAASGRISRQAMEAAPHLYVAGAIWTMYAGDRVLWQGDLLDPILDGATVRLTGRGWGMMAARETRRILYLSRGVDEWVPGDSPPFDYASAASWDTSSDGGRLEFLGRGGEEVAEGDKASFVFHAEGSEVTAVAGTMTWNGQGAGANTIRIASADFPEAPHQAGANIDPEDAGTFDRNLTGLEQDVAQIRVERDGTGDTFANTVRIQIRNLRVRGAAPEDEMASSEVAADVFDRLGVTSTDVDASGDDAMPLDVKGGTYADVLNHCSLLTGTPWRIASTGPEPHGTFTDGEDWTTFVDDGAKPTLLPVQRYNRVTVRFKSVSGRGRQVTATPDDIGVADPYAATGAIFGYALDVSQAHPDATKMQALAERLLAALIVQRYTGDLHRAWLVDDSGALRVAYDVNAGDRIRIADALGERDVTITVATKTSSAEGVAIAMAGTVPELDRYQARHEGGLG
jgi:hypothetical protein